MLKIGGLYKFLTSRGQLYYVIFLKKEPNDCVKIYYIFSKMTRIVDRFSFEYCYKLIS